MMLCEANERLKTVQINEGQRWALNSLYLLLDLDKDDFCKIVDLIGVEKLTAKRGHYDRLRRADDMLAARERYDDAKQRLAELDRERERLQETVSQYEETHSLSTWRRGFPPLFLFGWLANSDRSL